MSRRNSRASSSVASGSTFRSGMRGVARAVPYMTRAAINAIYNHPSHPSNAYIRRTSVRPTRHRPPVEGSRPLATRRATVRTPQVKGRVLKQKKKAPAVKVSKTFRAKVDKVLEPKKYIGTYNSEYYGKLTQLVTVNAQQASEGISNGANGALAVAAGTLIHSLMFFSPLRVNHAASVLFNGKTDSHLYTLETGNFVSDSLKLDVTYQAVTITLRNNTQVTKTVTWYECQAKSNSDTSAFQAWAQMLALAAGAGKENVTTTVPTTLNAKPGAISGFSPQWKYAARVNVLEPGQSVTFTMKGPEGLYDFSKFVESDAGGTAHESLVPEKYGVSCFYTVKQTHLEDAKDGNGGIGYPAHAFSATVSSAVTISVKQIMKVECPENAVVTEHFDKYTSLIAGTLIPIVVDETFDEVDEQFGQRVPTNY